MSDLKRYIVVTETAMLILQDVGEGMSMALRGWNSLYYLEKLSRDLDNPKLVSFEWKGAK